MGPSGNRTTVVWEANISYYTCLLLKSQCPLQTDITTMAAERVVNNNMHTTNLILTINHS